MTVWGGPCFAVPTTAEEAMAAMCPIDGCKAKKGLCVHDKIMLGMGVMAMGFASLHWGLGLL